MNNNKSRKRTTRLIFLLAVLSFLIATAQGLIYYNDYEPFFKYLLVLQNSINAFGFKASVTIKDTVAFIRNDPAPLKKGIGYAYCVAVFTALYCTISFIYKFLERILRFIIFFRRSRKCKHIVVAVNCAMQLEELFSESSLKAPILMRMDTDRRLAGYISAENSALADVSLIDDRSVVITLDMIINRAIDRSAKEYNHFYNNIALVTADEAGAETNSDADPEQEWNRLRLFRRSSSKAAAYHDEVKDDIIPKLAEESGTQLSDKLEELLGRDGSLMRYTDSAWQMRGSEEELLDTLKQDSFAYELAALEHRRWCCYMASIGWRAGERSDKFRRNPCIVTQQKLMETKPEMCKYDLMSLMARYRKMNG